MILYLAKGVSTNNCRDFPQNCAIHFIRLIRQLSKMRDVRYTVRCLYMHGFYSHRQIDDTQPTCSYLKYIMSMSLPMRCVCWRSKFRQKCRAKFLVSIKGELPQSKMYVILRYWIKRHYENSPTLIRYEYRYPP